MQSLKNPQCLTYNVSAAFYKPAAGGKFACTSLPLPINSGGNLGWFIVHRQCFDKVNEQKLLRIDQASPCKSSAYPSR